MASDTAVTAQTSGELAGLTLDSRRDAELQVIRLVGELDIATVVDVEREVRRLERIDRRVIALDLRELTFIDSSGMRLIFEAHQRASRASRRLVVLRGGPTIQRSFAICGLAETLPFVDELPAAVARPSAGTCVDRAGTSARTTRAAAQIQADATTATRRGDASVRGARTRRAATIRRRADEAALMAALRELRTRPRPGAVK
jgi:anti-anti-sigma factor